MCLPLAKERAESVVRVSDWGSRSTAGLDHSNKRLHAPPSPPPTMAIYVT